MHANAQREHTATNERLQRRIKLQQSHVAADFGLGREVEGNALLRLVIWSTHEKRPQIVMPANYAN
jgi:hypothetical protein